MSDYITTNHDIDVLVRAWTHKSTEDLAQAVDSLLMAGQWDVTTLQAVASRLGAWEGSDVRSLATDIAGSVVLSPQTVPSRAGYNVEVFAIPMTGTGEELAYLARGAGPRHAWAAAMKAHGLVAAQSQICILPGVWRASDLLAMTPQIIRDLGVAVGTALIDGQDVTLGPIPELAPLGAGIPFGSCLEAGVALAVVVDEAPDDGGTDLLRVLFDPDEEGRVEGPVPASVDQPDRAWTAAWTEAWTGLQNARHVPLSPVSIGDAMAAIIVADIMAQTVQAGAGPGNNVDFVFRENEVGGLSVEALIDGRSAMIDPIDLALVAACGSALWDRLGLRPPGAGQETRVQTVCTCGCD